MFLGEIFRRCGLAVDGPRDFALLRMVSPGLGQREHLCSDVLCSGKDELAQHEVAVLANWALFGGFH